MNFFEIISKTHLIDPTDRWSAGDAKSSVFHPFHRRSISRSSSLAALGISMSNWASGTWVEKNGISAWIKTSIKKNIPECVTPILTMSCTMSWWIFWTLKKKIKTHLLWSSFFFFDVVFGVMFLNFETFKFKRSIHLLDLRLCSKRFCFHDSQTVGGVWMYTLMFHRRSWKIYNDQFTVDFHGSCCKML